MRKFFAKDVDVFSSKLAINSQVPSSAGTVEASKFVQVDSNKDFTSVRNITGTGAFQAAEINIGASGWRFKLNGANLELQYYDTGSSSFVTKITSLLTLPLVPSTSGCPL